MAPDRRDKRPAPAGPGKACRGGRCRPGRGACHLPPGMLPVLLRPPPELPGLVGTAAPAADVRQPPAMCSAPDVVVTENLLRDDPVQCDPGHLHTLVLPHRPPAQCW